MPRRYRRRRVPRRKRRIYRRGAMAQNRYRYYPYSHNMPFDSVKRAGIYGIRGTAWRRTIGLPMGIFPKTVRARLKYATQCQINATQLAPSAYVFRANSLYDPEVSVGGHSAYAFDEIMRAYNKYRVISSKIKVWFINPAVSDQVCGYVTILRSDTGNMYAQFASSDHILECPARGNVRVVGQYQVANQVMQAQSPINTHTYSQRKYFPGILDQNFEAPYNDNPSKECFFEVTVFSLALNDPANLNFRVEIDYYAEFSEQIILPESGVNTDDTDLGGNNIKTYLPAGTAVNFPTGPAGMTGPRDFTHWTGG